MDPTGAPRDAASAAAREAGLRAAIPPFALCTDNAVMVAARGHELLRTGRTDGLDLPAVARAAPQGAA